MAQLKRESRPEIMMVRSRTTGTSVVLACISVTRGHGEKVPTVPVSPLEHRGVSTLVSLQRQPASFAQRRGCYGKLALSQPLPSQDRGTQEPMGYSRGASSSNSAVSYSPCPPLSWGHDHGSHDVSSQSRGYSKSLGNCKDSNR